jgi:chorismate mutase
LNILTITQSLPIHEQANVTLSLDISDLEIPLAQVVDELGKLEGVNQVRLLALE